MTRSPTWFLISPPNRRIGRVLKHRSPWLQNTWFSWVENNLSWHLLQGRHVPHPEFQSRVEMEDVEAEKPDDVVDVENCLWTHIVLQLAVEQQEKDV